MVLKRAVGRLGEPVIRQATLQAMRILGGQFVFGRTIDEALTNLAERVGNGAKVEDEVADGDPDPPLQPFAAEHAKGQVLDGKVAVAIGALDPAGQRRIVGVVETAHGSRALGKSAQARS